MLKESQMLWLLKLHCDKLSLLQMSNTAFFSCVGYIFLNNKVIRNDELERMWKVC